MDKSHTKITKSSLDAVKIVVPVNGNKILEEALKRINLNDEIKALWKVINVNATDRLGYSDHGPTHFKLVANYALQIARILEKQGVKMSIVDDFGLTNDHAETVIFLASILHDLGMSIHRVNHEQFSLFMARDFLKEVLAFLPVEERVVVTSETLHAIISHSHGSAGSTSTVEGGIVRVADALDMTTGRSRISYNKGLLIDIENVSNHAIISVDVKEGKVKPVEIVIVMTNPAGIFQIDDLVEEKLGPSKLEKYIGVKAIMKENGKEEIFKEFK
jgi:metal-dependent HD superfamily phosphatase/phosphodiesterase